MNKMNWKEYIEQIMGFATNIVEHDAIKIYKDLDPSVKPVKSNELAQDEILFNRKNEHLKTYVEEYKRSKKSLYELIEELIIDQKDNIHLDLDEKAEKLVELLQKSNLFTTIGKHMLVSPEKDYFEEKVREAKGVFETELCRCQFDREFDEL